MIIMAPLLFEIKTAFPLQRSAKRRMKKKQYAVCEAFLTVGDTLKITLSSKNYQNYCQ